jgi:hypothetical protein
MKAVKSFGILVEGYRGRAGHSGNRRGNVKIWDASGMVCFKCFGILVEAIGGGVGIADIARHRRNWRKPELKPR